MFEKNKSEKKFNFEAKQKKIESLIKIFLIFSAIISINIKNSYSVKAQYYNSQEI
jgi:hypothetical protein